MLLIWRDEHVLPEAYENILVHFSSCFHFHSNFAQIRRMFSCFQSQFILVLSFKVLS